MNGWVKLLLCLLGVILVIWLGLALISRGHCAYAGWSMERDTKYVPFMGCLTKSGDKWLPLSGLREVE